MNASSISTTRIDRGQLLGRRLVCLAIHLVAYLYLTFKPIFLTEVSYRVAFSVPLAQTALLTLLALQIDWRTEWRFVLAIVGLVASWYSLSKFGIWSVGGASAAEMAITLIAISIASTIAYWVFRAIQFRAIRAKQRGKTNGKEPIKGEPHPSGATLGLKSLVLWTTLFAILFALTQYGEGYFGWSSKNVSRDSLAAHLALGAPLGIIAVTLLALSESWTKGASFGTTAIALGVIIACIAFQNLGIWYFVPRPGWQDWTTYLTEISFSLIVGATLVFWPNGPSSSNEASRI